LNDAALNLAVGIWSVLCAGGDVHLQTGSYETTLKIVDGAPHWADFVWLESTHPALTKEEMSSWESRAMDAVVCVAVRLSGGPK
jgi:hypothetical protein